METSTKRRAGIACLTIVTMVCLSPAFGSSYPSLEGVDGLNVTYDIRLAHPQKTALFLRLIHETYKNEELSRLPRTSRFVLVFNGESVTLISDDVDRFPRDDRTALEEIAARIESMAADGVRIEGCLTAAKIFGVDPNRFHEEIRHIDNAWISIAGYQAQEFSIIPVY